MHKLVHETPGAILVEAGDLFEEGQYTWIPKSHCGVVKEGDNLVLYVSLWMLSRLQSVDSYVRQFVALAEVRVESDIRPLRRRFMPWTAVFEEVIDVPKPTPQPTPKRANVRGWSDYALKRWNDDWRESFEALAPFAEPPHG